MLKPTTFEITQAHIDTAPKAVSYTDNVIYNAITEQTDLNVLYVSHFAIRITNGNFVLSPALQNMRKHPKLLRPCTVKITAIVDHTRPVEGDDPIPTTGHVEIVEYH